MKGNFFNIFRQMDNYWKIYTISSIALLIYTLFLLSCNHKNEKNADDESLINHSNEYISETAFNRIVNVVPEQDSNGILWGLRDTFSGKLVLDYTYGYIGNFKEGFAFIRHNGYFGLINQLGKVIIYPEYTSPLTELKCGTISFEVGYGPLLIIDNTGKAIRPMTSSITNFLPCEKRIALGYHGHGMINFKGDTILPFKFRNTYLIQEGYCIAKDTNSLYGLYDLNGKQILPHWFERIGEFSCGRATVLKYGKCGVIDLNGKELFYTAYSGIGDYSNGFAKVYSKSKNNDHKVGFIDKNGNEVVPPIYQDLELTENFSEGIAAVPLNFKYGFIDTTGKVIIPFKYQRVESFQNGIAKVWIDDEHVGYINKKGKEVIPVNFDPMDQANLKRYYNKFVIALKDLVHHVFDYSGKEVAALNYETVREFNDIAKSFIVTKNNKCGVMDSNFRIIIPVEFESIYTIFPGKIAAHKRNKIVFLNYKCKAIFPFNYNWVSPMPDDNFDTYYNGLAKVGLNGKTGVINSYGNLIIPAKYDEIEGFSHGLALVKRNNKYGFINAKGKEIIPAIYDNANSYNGYTAEVTLNGKTFQIDMKGKLVEEDEGC